MNITSIIKSNLIAQCRAEGVDITPVYVKIRTVFHGENPKTTMLARWIDKETKQQVEQIAELPNDESSGDLRRMILERASGIKGTVNVMDIEIDFLIPLSTQKVFYTSHAGEKLSRTYSL